MQKEEVFNSLLNIKNPTDDKDKLKLESITKFDKVGWPVFEGHSFHFFRE